MNIDNLRSILVMVQAAGDLSSPFRQQAATALAEAIAALDEIHEILDGDPNDPGKSWSSDEIGCVAEVIIALGYTIREPGEDGEEDEAE